MIIKVNIEIKTYENGKNLGSAIILLIISLWLLGQPLIAQSPKIDLPQEWELSTVQDNSLVVGHPTLFGNEKEVWSAVWEASHKYPNISFDLLYELARCESGLNHNKYGDSGKAYGLFQWWQSSWDMYNKKFGTNLDRKNVYDQAIMTAKVLDIGGQRNWFNCFRRPVLGDLIK